MMVDPDKGGALWQLSVTEASKRIAAGTLSPVDLVEACLARIEAVDGKIHSFIHVAADQARAAAREAEAEERKAEEEREFERARRYDGKGYAEEKPRSRSSRSDSIGTAFAKSFARQLGTRSGQALVRGILGSIFGKR